ncbi:hypothetical protein [Eubacterium barkeri]|uniref:Uncharacterized protein n=1 Tax=Eubacterium barkeri TaxID=1528 RepID=A0A1H3BGC7_EUBBA|nr:hypothetical protein [Eubacterium barkeri]SDX40956.1 hypothetical protein SAMN04488579_10269 [Eubacterium barkeri]
MEERSLDIGGLSVEIKAVGIETMMNDLEALTTKLKEASELIDEISNKRMQLQVKNLFADVREQSDV